MLELPKLALNTFTCVYQRFEGEYKQTDQNYHTRKDYGYKIILNNVEKDSHCSQISQIMMEPKLQFTKFTETL